MTCYIAPEDYKKAEENGISNATLYHRVYVYGWDVERAISQPIQKQNIYKWCDWKHIAEKHGICRKTFVTRIRKGWSHEKAATTKVMDKKEQARLSYAARQTTVFTKEQLKRMRENGVAYGTAWRRVRIHGWSPEEAIKK